jgi:undecaprenyl-diphosphatase
MSLIYAFLGILQGIFEWVPISSEGIAALFSKFFIKDFHPVDVALFLHLGTLLAVLIYFRKDWKEIITFKNQKLLRFLLITTFTSLIVGYPVYKTIKDMAIGNTFLLIMGFGLLLTSFFHKSKRNLKLNPTKLAMIAGILQGLAVIPGLSRSGSTIFGLSLGKDNPEDILKISYLMSGPIIFASSLYLFLENSSLVFEFWPSLIFSFLVGILSLDFILKAVKKINFFKFSLIFSLLCFLGALIGFLT